jgi:hypothetical protein
VIFVVVRYSSAAGMFVRGIHSVNDAVHMGVGTLISQKVDFLRESTEQQFDLPVIFDISYISCVRNKKLDVSMFTDDSGRYFDE